MSGLVLSKILFVILLTCSLGYTQDNQQPTPETAPSHDYFTAHEVTSTKGYLDNLTLNHTDKILGYIRENKIDAATFDVKYTLDRFANHPKGLQMAIVVSRLTKQPSLAVVYFESALKLYPQYAITYAQYGTFLLGNGQVDVAIVRLKQAVGIDPTMAGAYVLLARAYTKKGNNELASEAAEKARTLGFNGEITLQ